MADEMIWNYMTNQKIQSEDRPWEDSYYEVYENEIAGAISIERR
jgi:hypothetical protein